MEPVRPVQRKIYHIYIYIYIQKDVGCHLDSEPSIQEMQQVQVAIQLGHDNSSNKLYGPYLWVGFNSLKAVILSGQLTKLYKVLISLRWFSSKTYAALSTSPSHGFLQEN